MPKVSVRMLVSDLRLRAIYGLLWLEEDVVQKVLIFICTAGSRKGIVK